MCRSQAQLDLLRNHSWDTGGYSQSKREGELQVSTLREVRARGLSPAGGRSDWRELTGAVSLVTVTYPFPSNCLPFFHILEHLGLASVGPEEGWGRIG